MRFPILVLLAFVLVTRATGAPEAPKLIATSPEAWAVGVSARLKSISLTFDQRMRPDSAAWFGTESISPETFGETGISPDQRSISLPISLLPGKVYVFSLNENSTPGVGFQNVRGFPLPRHYLVFQTAGPPAPEDVPPRVVRALPENNAQQVASSLTSVTVIFDKQMNVKKHGVQMRENGRPVDLSKAVFQYASDGRTFTLTHQFKPSTDYELELNSSQNIGFAAANLVPLWPVRLAFRTGPPQ